MDSATTGPALSRQLLLSKSFAVVFDDKARRWLNEHPSQDAPAIAYEDSRCCGGGHIREVWLRRSHTKETRGLRWSTLAT